MVKLSEAMQYYRPTNCLIGNNMNKKVKKVKKDNKMNYFIVRMWGRKNYPNAKPFSGQIRPVSDGKDIWFHSAGEFLTILEKLNK